MKLNRTNVKVGSRPLFGVSIFLLCVILIISYIVIVLVPFSGFLSFYELRSLLLRMAGVCSRPLFGVSIFLPKNLLYITVVIVLVPFSGFLSFYYGGN